MWWLAIRLRAARPAGPSSPTTLANTDSVDDDQRGPRSSSRSATASIEADPTSVSTGDAGEHLIHRGRRCQPCELGGEILLEGLPCFLSAALKTCMHLIRQIAYQNIRHACIMLSTLVTGATRNFRAQIGSDVRSGQALPGSSQEPLLPSVGVMNSIVTPDGASALCQQSCGTITRSPARSVRISSPEG